MEEWKKIINVLIPIQFYHPSLFNGVIRRSGVDKPLRY
jgi:hypothetical protein